MNSFVAERIHRRVKLMCSQIRCTKRFEKTPAESVFSTLLCREAAPLDKLRGKIIPTKSGEASTSLDVTSTSGLQMSAYDMVWFGGSVGRVFFFVKTSDKPIQAMVELCRLVSEQACYSVVRRLGHHTNALVPLVCASPAVAWATSKCCMASLDRCEAG